ncbi:MAG: hypothetical protein ABL949_06510 [Fimbriimonadaceae bacterium]
MNEFLNVDAELEQTEMVGGILRALPEHELSMGWRVGLDQKLSVLENPVSALPDIEPSHHWRAQLDQKLAVLENPLSALPDVEPSQDWRAQLNEKLVAVDKPKSVFARLLKGLPEESPNLVWRSKLNEQIRTTSKPRRVFSLWRPALTAGLAGALIVAVTVQMRSTPVAPVAQNEANVVDWMVQTHEQTVAYSELGLNQPTEQTGVTVIEEPADLSVWGI